MGPQNIRDVLYYILNFFDKKLSIARREYRKFVQKGIGEGKKPELTGGGLIRSAGGWAAVKALRKAKTYMKGDERILGDSDFVHESLQQAEEQLEQKYKIQSQGFEIDKIARRVGEIMDMSAEQVLAAGKNRQIVRARSLLCYWGVRKCGITMVSLSKRLGISPAAVGLSVKRGQKIAEEYKYRLLKH